VHAGRSNALRGQSAASSFRRSRSGDRPLGSGRAAEARRTPRTLFDAALATVSGDLAAITPEIAIIAAGLRCHGDPADRLIIATALASDAVLVTRDAAILELASSGKELRVLEA